MPIGTKIAVAVKQRVYEMWIAGKTRAEITKATGVKKNTLCWWIQHEKWTKRRKAMADKMLAAYEDSEIDLIRSTRVPVVRQQLENVMAVDKALCEEFAKKLKRIRNGETCFDENGNEVPERLDWKDFEKIASTIAKTQSAASHIAGDRRNSPHAPISAGGGIVQMGGIIQVGLRPIRKVQKVIEAECKEVQNAGTGTQQEVVEAVRVDQGERVQQGECGQDNERESEEGQAKEEVVNGSESKEFSDVLRKALAK